LDWKLFLGQVRRFRARVHEKFHLFAFNFGFKHPLVCRAFLVACECGCYHVLTKLGYVAHVTALVAPHRQLFSTLFDVVASLTAVLACLCLDHWLAPQDHLIELCRPSRAITTDVAFLLAVEATDRFLTSLDLGLQRHVRLQNSSDWPKTCLHN